MGLEPKKGTEGVVGHDLLGKGITWGIFEAVSVLKAVVDDDDDAIIGLGILDGCDLLSVLDDVIFTLIAFALANCCLPRKNKYLGLYLLFT